MVLDTNVVASAVLWGGVPRLLLQAGRDKRIELFTSAALLAELTDILGRRKFAIKIAASTHAYTAHAPDPDDDVVFAITRARVKREWRRAASLSFKSYRSSG